MAASMDNYSPALKEAYAKAKAKPAPAIHTPKTAKTKSAGPGTLGAD